ncbi:DciA family protein [Deinococcus peraridilitoris]|uniref:Putative RNA-binding protein containing Zn ribbon n=1 Tax=Deinococcus peraridilitoris (strain DSM 19664 / LMG 22246 / CIP 109416 / KR-200) TaxID=937777 RepID=K9ZXN9_DEIPD|nr:DciA family protein [Deinococcus peraridilitoris]AFZ65964.1 putative RNA-binding protein containing Zn ribbon [Deinococcus peraridilitoris DSM 19664]
MTRRRTGGTRDWRLLLSQTLSRNRLARGVARARAVLLWPEVVGPELARLTRARAQQGRVLFVEAQDSVLANFLTMQRHVFLDRLQAKLGDDSVGELRFAVGTWNHPEEVRPPEPLPPPDKARAAELVEHVPEGVRESALRAAEAITRARLWRERQGWDRCPVCGTPSRSLPCLPCHNLLKEAQVQQGARILARTPEAYSPLTQEIAESGAEAARFLALNTLSEQLEILALECVKEGGSGEYRVFLYTQAEIWLSLQLRKPRSLLTRTDWRELPERPRAVLSAGR